MGERYRQDALKGGVIVVLPKNRQPPVGAVQHVVDVAA
jgi:hypothetical protein